MTDHDVTHGPWDETASGVIRRAIGVSRALDEPVCFVSTATWHALTTAQRAAFERQSAVLGIEIIPQEPATPVSDVP